jgi:hypothetical protein
MQTKPQRSFGAIDALLDTRITSFLPYENGFMCGEDTYIDVASATVVKLDPIDVVTPEEALAGFVG